jgi:hypothetical protein
LKFDGDQRFNITQFASTVTLGYAKASQLSFSGSLGVVFDGSINAMSATSNADGSNDIGAGIVGSVGVAKQWAFADRGFITGTVGFAMSRTTAAATSLIAADLRLGAMVGYSLGPVSPYALVRAFGGPVSWRIDQKDVRGTDIHHYQLGAGLSANLWRGASALLDLSALGERAGSLAFSLQM